jgi:Tfp pilus assembly protein PilF/predicted Ser/Thr protein kinase
MQCPLCQADNPPTAVSCTKCSTPIPFDDQTLGGTSLGSSSTDRAVSGGTDAWSVAVTHVVGASAVPGEQLVGTLLAGRYEFLSLLGQGGMGAVYKARDTELDRIVALKLIRPELARDPETLRRFKQELILARQVTHKNVIRIFDLGQSDGIKFITMDFVEGQDLRQLLRARGKFPAEQAAKIMLQICRALEAAHTEGVIHRDLKPQNIMLDSSGRVYVMDFGIARSAYLPGMTQTGQLIGTPDYMSPEQARGEKLTERSDLFSLGVIFYELLTAKSPYPAEAPLETLWKRMQEKPTPPIVIDPEVPKPLSDIVMKALEIKVEDRVSSARAMAHQLEIWLGPSVESSTIFLPAPRTTLNSKWASAALAMLLAVAGVAFWLKNPAKPKAAHAPLSILVADFTNHTGDPIFDGTLEPMVNVALEGASFVNAFSRGEARKLAQRLPHPTDKLDEQPARLVAVSQGIGAVVTGELSRRGDKYSLSATALDAVSGNVIAKTEVTAANKDEVLLSIPKLAAPIRKALGDTTPESVQLTAAGGAFQAASLEVVHQYGVAMDQQSAGKMDEAMTSFSKAAELDPNFARAYAGMASTARNLGRPQDAEKDIKLAIEHVDRMTERERYRIRGLYYLETQNWEKCVEEYSELVKQYPADNIGHNNLSLCYDNQHNTLKAMEELQRSLEISPQDQLLRTNLALDLSYTGDFSAAEREARTALQSNPSSETGYAALAYAQVGQGQLAQAIETYRQLQKISSLGQSMAAPGLADIAVYEGRLTDAVRLLEAGAAADLRAGRLDSAAADFTMLGHTQLLRKQKTAALSALGKALANSKAVSPRFAAARIYAAAGETSEAHKLADGLASELQLEPPVYAKLIEGEIALEEKDARKAIQLFSQANNQLDTWIGHFDLGRAYLEADSFVEADSEFDRCINRRGETLDLFDYVPTYGYLPEVYYYQGRVREALKSRGAADSFQAYLNIRGKAGEDPLLPEVRHRLGQ